MSETKSVVKAPLVAAVAMSLGGCFAGIGDSAEVQVEDPETGNPVPTVPVSGTVQSYWTAMLGQDDPLPGAAVRTVGLATVRTVDSNAEGQYDLGQVPTSSLFYTSISVPQPLAFRTTHSESIRTANVALDQSLYAVSAQDIARQYTSTRGPETVPAPGTAFVVVDLQQPDGTPLAGIGPEAFEIVDGQGLPVLLDGPTQGPFFVGSLGDAVATETLGTSATFFGSARAVILDLTPGQYTLVITYLDADLEVTNRSPLFAAADQATLVLSGGAEPVSGEAPEGSFRAAVYPLLQRASVGGDGCANCHTAGGQAPNLLFDGDPQEVHQALVGDINRVNLASPLESLLLTKPTAGVPEGDLHPSVYADDQDPSYAAILQWIQDGALL